MFSEKDVNRFKALKLNGFSINQKLEIADAKTEGNTVNEQELYLMKELGWDLQKIRDVIEDCKILGLIQEISGELND